MRFAGDVNDGVTTNDQTQVPLARGHCDCEPLGAFGAQSLQAIEEAVVAGENSDGIR